MKFIWQGITVFLSLSLPVIMFFYDKGIAISSLKKPLVGVNGFVFILSFFLFLVLYVMLAIKEKTKRYVCYSLAQWICIYGCILSVLIVGQSYIWLVFEMTTAPPPWVSFFGKLIIFMLFPGSVLVGQYICVTSFGRSIFGGKSVIKTKKHIGEYAIKNALQYDIDPIALERLLEEAHRQQISDSLRINRGENDGD